MSAATDALFVLGSSHHEAPLDVRERFALPPEASDALQRRLADLPGVRELMVLNTCNRMEIYAVADRGEAPGRIRRAFCEARGIEPGLFDRHSFFRRDLEAIQHLLEVASGVDSQMIGETEILGQLKQAHTAARDLATVGPVLERLLQKGFQAAKQVRTNSSITTGQISIGNVVVELAARIFGGLERSQVLLLGSGEVAEKAAQALRSRGAGNITVSSRRFERARQLAHTFGGAAIDFADFVPHLQHYDIILSSTAAPGHLLDFAAIQAALRARPERPFFIIDVAMPRDVDPAVSRLDNVFLYDLDDISRIANENLENRAAEIGKVRNQLSRAAWAIWLQLRRRFAI